MSTCEKQVQPITARIITNEKGEKTYDSSDFRRIISGNLSDPVDSCISDRMADRKSKSIREDN